MPTRLYFTAAMSKNFAVKKSARIKKTAVPKGLKKFSVGDVHSPGCNFSKFF